MNRYVIIVVLALIVLGSAGASAENIDPRAVDFYLKGLFLESHYDFVHAFSFYSYADRFAPENGTVIKRLAVVTLKMGDLDKARRYATDLLGKKSFDTEAQLILAEVEFKEGDSRAALDRLRHIKDREDAPRFQVLKLLAQVYLDLDRVGEARGALEAANAIFPNDLFVQYRLGYIYMDSGEIEKAIPAFAKAIEINPGFASAHLTLASLLRYTGRTDEAKVEYRTALKLEPTNRTAFREYIELLVELEDFEAGIEYLEPLSGEGKLEEGGEITLGRLYYRAGKTEEALGLFKRLAERKGSRPFILRIIADIEMELGNLRSSYRYRTKAVEAEPDTFENYVGLLMLTGGLAGEASGPHEELEIPDEEVRGYFERAVETMDGSSAEDNYLIGLLHRRHGHLDEAARYLLEAERLGPDDRRTAMELASLYEDRGEYDEALARIIRQYEKNPTDAGLMNFYGYLLAEKEADLGRAEDLLREALRQEPDNGYFMDSLGWIKFKQAEYGRALEMLLRAVDLVVDDPVIWVHLGDIYRALERDKEAADAYRRSLDIDPDDDGVQEKIRLIEGGDR